MFEINHTPRIAAKQVAEVSHLTDRYHDRGEWLVRLSESLQIANSLFVDEMYRLAFPESCT
jgi:hypothetical protein